MTKKQEEDWDIRVVCAVLCVLIICGTVLIALGHTDVVILAVAVIIGLCNI